MYSGILQKTLNIPKIFFFIPKKQGHTPRYYREYSFTKIYAIFPYLCGNISSRPCVSQLWSILTLAGQAGAGSPSASLARGVKYYCLWDNSHHISVQSKLNFRLYRNEKASQVSASLFLQSSHWSSSTWLLRRLFQTDFMVHSIDSIFLSFCWFFMYCKVNTVALQK